MKLGLIKKSEKELLNKIAEANENENSLWYIPNLLIPIGAIILTIICFFAFSDKRYDYAIYANLILNGSLPLIAINQISGTGVYIFRFDRNKERLANLDNDTISLRTKLLYSSFGILTVGVILFAFQVINTPYLNPYLVLFLLAISSFLIWISSNVAKKIFLLQEDFIEKTFDDNMRDKSKELGKDWSNR